MTSIGARARPPRVPVGAAPVADPSPSPEAELLVIAAPDRIDGDLALGLVEDAAARGQAAIDEVVLCLRDRAGGWRVRRSRPAGELEVTALDRFAAAVLTDDGAEPGREAGTAEAAAEGAAAFVREHARLGEDIVLAVAEGSLAALLATLDDAWPVSVTSFPAAAVETAMTARASATGSGSGEATGSDRRPR